MSDSTGYRIVTHYDETVIRQELFTFDSQGIQKKLWERVVLLEEEGLRKALVALGWSEPATPLDVSHAHHHLVNSGVYWLIREGNMKLDDHYTLADLEALVVILKNTR